MAELKKAYWAICKEISRNAKEDGNADEFYAYIGKKGILMVWESENLHPGEQYIWFGTEDGKSRLHTSCGKITIKNNMLNISTQKSQNKYSFLLLDEGENT